MVQGEVSGVYHSGRLPWYIYGDRGSTVSSVVGDSGGVAVFIRLTNTRD
jgi:hypothetical protein